MKSLRKIAVHLLLQLINSRDRKVRLDNSLRQVIESHQLSPQDGRLLRSMVLGTCRHWHALTWLLTQHCHTPIEKLSPLVSVLLRLGLYQLHCMDKIPDYAVVKSMVQLAKQLKQPPHISGLINAVLRASLRSPRTLPPESFIPDWLRSVYPTISSAALADLITTQPELGLRLRPQAFAQAEDLKHQFMNAGWSVRQPFIERPDCWLLAPTKNAVSLIDLPGYAEGWWVIQETSSASVIPLLDNMTPTVIVDACAGLGMKSIHLADRFPGAKIIALEPDRQRFQRLQENIARLKIHNIQPVQTKAQDWQPSDRVDLVLVDAPCSATGTLRRHPEILVQWQMAALPPVLDVQAQLLACVSLWIKSGGQLVYSTCSILPAEGPEQIQRFCQTHPGIRKVRDTSYTIQNTNDGFYIAIISF